MRRRRPEASWGPPLVAARQRADARAIEQPRHRGPRARDRSVRIGLYRAVNLYGGNFTGTPWAFFDFPAHVEPVALSPVPLFSTWDVDKSTDLVITHAAAITVPMWSQLTPALYIGTAEWRMQNKSWAPPDPTRPNATGGFDIPTQHDGPVILALPGDDLRDPAPVPDAPYVHAGSFVGLGCHNSWGQLQPLPRTTQIYAIVVGYLVPARSVEL